MSRALPVLLIACLAGACAVEGVPEDDSSDRIVGVQGDDQGTNNAEEGPVPVALSDAEVFCVASDDDPVETSNALVALVDLRDGGGIPDPELVVVLDHEELAVLALHCDGLGCGVQVEASEARVDCNRLEDYRFDFVVVGDVRDDIVSIPPG